MLLAAAPPPRRRVHARRHPRLGRALPARVGAAATRRSRAPPTCAPPPTAAVPRRPAASGCSTGSTTPTRTRTAASSAPGATRATGSSPSTGVDATTAWSRPSTPSTPAPSAAEPPRSSCAAASPVVYAAHGSHASYLHAGTRDRLWPDPNDEADGRGQRHQRPGRRDHARRARVDDRPRALGRLPRLRLVPMEQDSPPGPVFQPARWDAETFAADARPCQADCNAGRRMRHAREGRMTAGADRAARRGAAYAAACVDAGGGRPPGGATG